MTKEEIVRLAAEEYCSEELSPHPTPGNGKPFWNAEATRFTYVPAFQFQPIPGSAAYRFRALDETGAEHVFEAKSPKEPLTPVWKNIPVGTVELKVFALNGEGKETHLVGARTFFRSAPFSGDYPEAACSYKDCAGRAYDYAFRKPYIQHWLTHGTPDPDYDHYVYPSKMISAVVNAMIDYASVCPEKADDALLAAKRAADYLIGCTLGPGSAMEGIPPTFKIDFRPNPETRNNFVAAERIDWVMMLYPCYAAVAYLNLEKVTGDKKYLDAALKIGEYFAETVEENGSWFLIRSRTTGEPISPNYCMPLQIIMPMMMKLYGRTGDARWKKLADGALAYVEKTVLKSFNWEGQFEDSPVSLNYSNLTHYGANALARYYCDYYSGDPEKMKIAEDLVRFAEDQFVIWGKAAPWDKMHFDTSIWITPCGTEQYNWNVPIDASTTDFVNTFLSVFRATGNPLYLEKAKALANSVTRVQLPDGMIPTHWMNDAYMHGKDFWVNCLFYSAGIMSEFARFTEKAE